MYIRYMCYMYIYMHMHSFKDNKLDLPNNKCVKLFLFFLVKKKCSELFQDQYHF